MLFLAPTGKTTSQRLSAAVFHGSLRATADFSGLVRLELAIPPAARHLALMGR